MAKDIKAYHIEQKTFITVYRSSRRDTWINSGDLKTEYNPNELEFNKEHAR